MLGYGNCYSTDSSIWFMYENSNGHDLFMINFLNVCLHFFCCNNEIAVNLKCIKKT